MLWAGTRSIELGLADELGSVRSIARDVIGEDEMIDYTPKEDFLTQLSDRFGVAAGSFVARFLQQGQGGLR